ncbi:MAG TPA: fasciclin domain-containing protein, partial [Chitinophagaceae bacterium]|nr:fasciclin domain-containing protein [Chitinophagaceae bacterium]
MKRYINNWRLFSVLFAAGTIMLSACNKELPEPEPIVTPAPTGATILETLDDPNYSFLKAAVTRASTINSPTGKLTTILGDRNAVFTFFAPDDNAFKASLSALGLPADISSINFIPAGQLDTIIKYHLIGGQEFTSAKVTPVSPSLNLYLQSTLM